VTGGSVTGGSVTGGVVGEPVRRVTVSLPAASWLALLHVPALWQAFTVAVFDMPGVTLLTVHW
jgi:hypothetical protein